METFCLSHGYFVHLKLDVIHTLDYVSVSSAFMSSNTIDFASGVKNEGLTEIPS